MDLVIGRGLWCIERTGKDSSVPWSIMTLASVIDLDSHHRKETREKYRTGFTRMWSSSVRGHLCSIYGGQSDLCSGNHCQIVVIGQL